MKNKTLNLVLASLVLACSLSADIGPPTVTYTSTPSAGGNILDFTVSNNTNQPLYFFGVSLPAVDITNSPGGFSALSEVWNNSPYGGSNIDYNNVWGDRTYTADPPGTVTSGFEVFVTGAAPTSVNWFAFTFIDFGYPVYDAGGNFNNIFNPGFEGVAQLPGAAAAPEPSYIALAAGIVGLIAFRKFRVVRQQQSR